MPLPAANPTDGHGHLKWMIQVTTFSILSEGGAFFKWDGHIIEKRETLKKGKGFAHGKNDKSRTELTYKGGLDIEGNAGFLPGHGRFTVAVGIFDV